jgi:hypothetical protein
MDEWLHNTTAKNYHRNTEHAIERGTYLLWTRQSQPLSTTSCVETGSRFYSDSGAQLEHLPEQVDLIPSPVAAAPQRIACGRLHCYSFVTSTVGGESATWWNTVLRRINAYLSFPPFVFTPNEHPYVDELAASGRTDCSAGDPREPLGDHPVAPAANLERRSHVAQSDRVRFAAERGVAPRH